MIDSGKKITSFILGVIFLAVGVVPLLNDFGVIGFNLPLLSFAFSFAFWLFTIGGIFILVDAHLEDHTLKVPSTIIGILLMAIGVIGILSGFGIVPFAIPFMTPLVLEIMFTIEGLFLVIAAFAV